MIRSLIFPALLVFFLGMRSFASDLYIGTATVDITPPLPVALMGQFHLRIAKEAETPLSASVLLLENREGGKSSEVSVMVSCDLVYISSGILEGVRARVKAQIPSLDVSKIVLSATHTHTAPVLEDESDGSFFLYNIPKEGVTQISTYKNLVVSRVSDGIVKAWKTRSAGTVTWGLDRAAIGYNRRTVYADGKTVMYGATNTPGFRNLEGYEDHDVNTLFFWNREQKLIAMGINVACPAQEVEGRSTVNADYWHVAREALRKQYGSDVAIIAWIGAAGDQSPHPMYRKKAEERMRKLGGFDRMEDIAARIVGAVGRTYNYVKNEATSDIVLHHQSQKVDLPMRIITGEEYEGSKKIRDDAKAKIAADPRQADKLNAQMTWNDDVVRRFDLQKSNPGATYQSEIHVIRIGDVVICTNQFELFTDFGIRIQARSKALQTFVVQLAGPGTYLATQKAVAGGGYSAVCQSNVVSPEGGQVLVDRTLELIDKLWESKAK